MRFREKVQIIGASYLVSISFSFETDNVTDMVRNNKHVVRTSWKSEERGMFQFSIVKLFCYIIDFYEDLRFDA